MQTSPCEWSVFFSQQEGFFDLQEALQAIHMRQETLREQLAQARSKGEETLTRNIQVCVCCVCHITSVLFSSVEASCRHVLLAMNSLHRVLCLRCFRGRTALSTQSHGVTWINSIWFKKNKDWYFRKRYCDTVYRNINVISSYRGWIKKMNEFGMPTAAKFNQEERKSVFLITRGWGFDY